MTEGGEVDGVLHVDVVTASYVSSGRAIVLNVILCARNEMRRSSTHHTGQDTLQCSQVAVSTAQDVGRVARPR